MTVISVPLWLQGGTYAADDDRALLRSLVKAAGVVVPATDLLVSQNGTPNMSVQVNSGRAFVQRTSATDFYLVENDALANLTISAADPTNPRRDLVVARVYDAAFSGALNQATVEVVTGTPAGSPADPTTPANSYVVARVAVAAAASSIVNANITDLRTCYQPNRPANSNIVFTTSGTLTAAQCQGATGLRVRAWGPGGAGGGAPLTIASQCAAGAGGGSGAFCESVLDFASVTFPVTITVGTGGTDVAGADGGAGSGNTSFASQVVAGPGGGGQAGSASGTAFGVIGFCLANGAATTGDIKAAGSYGGPGVRFDATHAVAGQGGAAPAGGGASQSNTNSAVGFAGNFPGGGGGGASNAASQAARAGGNGANGLLVVELIY